MRPDLNKLLCERERYGSHEGYHAIRRSKKFIDAEVGGKEGMKFRYGWETKRLNENLNPLFGAVRKAVGRPWNKFYSELCKSFDKRSVINQHILDHLFQHVKVDTFLERGEVMVRRLYGLPAEPLRGSSSEYYVDPRDGILKHNKWHKGYKAILREREVERVRAELLVYRKLNDGSVLRKIGDVWFHFTMKEIPEGRVVYDKPLHADKFRPNRWNEEKSWDQLTDLEKSIFGRFRFVSGRPATDIFTGETVYRNGEAVYVLQNTRYLPSGKRSLLYHATKETASHKLLKKEGIV